VRKRYSRRQLSSFEKRFGADDCTRFLGEAVEYATFNVRRGKARISSGCDSRPATWSLQPVAIGAAVEVTKPPEPSMERVASATPRAGRP
jgi:hypothetical protein